MAIFLSVGHHLVTVRDCPREELRQLYQLLSYEEKSSYYQRMVKGIPPVYKRLFDPKTCTFPKGLLERVQTYLERQGYTVQTKFSVPHPGLRPFTIPDWAYEFQKRAVLHLLQHPHSTLQSPTGSGKTVIGSFLLGHIRGRCLMVVPSQDLLFQTAEKLAAILGEPVGMIGAGRKEWQRINVGIINSLVKVKDSPEVHELEAVIYDEAHRAIQFSRYGAFAEALTRCYFQWGLTAGAHREDGADLALEAIIGPTKMVISEREVEALGLTIKPQIYFITQPDPNCVYGGKFKVVGGERIYETPNGKPELREVYRGAVVLNEARNQAVVRVVETYLQHHTLPVLVLVESLEHGEILSQRLQCPFISGESRKEERLQNLEALRNGTVRVTVATRAYNEGVDIPRLGLVVNAAGGCSRQQMRQKVGRGVRQSQGKSGAVVIDFLDQERYYLRRQAKRRYAVSEEIYPGSCHILTLEEVCARLGGGAYE
jgi:superfamily II DNA or RNA helicase